MIKDVLLDTFPIISSIKHQLENRKEMRRLRHSYLTGVDSILNRYDATSSLFVHVPKTAGKSIGHSIYGSDVNWNHWTAREIRQIIGRRKFNEYFKFAFVRDPWQRVYSAYLYLKQGGSMIESDQWYANHVLVDYPTFEDFVVNGLKDRRIVNQVLFMPQHKFVCDLSGRLIIDYVGRFENIAADYAHVCSEIGIDSQLAVENRTRNKISPVSRYSSEMVAIITDFYARDIELLEYSPPETG